jgi:hypothetical protein
MNERIRELAVQARNYALDEKRIYERIHNTEQCMEEYREVYNKKLAELIVGECKENFAKVWYEQGLDVRGAELNKFMLQFNEHFGVTE